MCSSLSNRKRNLLIFLRELINFDCRSIENLCLEKDQSVKSILITKPTGAPISQIYFWNRTLCVSDRFSVHHQQPSTAHTAIHTGYADYLLASS